MMVLAAALLLVLTPLGCYWLAGRATAPIAQIIRTTSQLRPSQLNERLPLRNTGDELDQLSQTINGLLDRLASFVNEKRDFLANAAHELRSPLAAIRSSVEVALNSKRSSGEYVALLEEIMEECSDLGVLVNQLLLLTESEKADLGPPSGPVALDRVTRRSFNMFQGVAEAEGLELTLTQVDTQIWVHGDEHHLQQVINNLVDNAIKFTAPAGKVQVEVRSLADEGFALLQVSDTGMGIAVEDQGRIFERFYRGDHSRQRQGHQRGNGLGLAICHSIVTSLGGSITVQSQPGVGSTFRVKIPLAKP
jgi:signal transduction histidine kinase